MQHRDNCQCQECRTWFMQHKCGSGRCGRCNEPVDDHALNHEGSVTACPAKKVSA